MAIQARRKKKNNTKKKDKKSSKKEKRDHHHSEKKDEKHTDDTHNEYSDRLGFSILEAFWACRFPYIKLNFLKSNVLE